jgi:hypothetical protein
LYKSESQTSPTETTTKNILHIGDSELSAGLYGTKLSELLKQRYPSVKVITKGVGGSTIKTWINGNYVNNGMAINVPEETDHRGEKEITEKLSELITKTDAKLVIITLGTNDLANSLKNEKYDIQSLSKKLVSLIPDEVMCIWIGIPKMNSTKDPRYSEKNINRVNSLIKLGIGKKCLFIDSRQITSDAGIIAGSSDGIHYGNEESITWAKLVFEEMIKIS